MTPLELGFVLFVLLAVSAFFAACEVAFLSVSNLKMHSLLEKHANGAEPLARLRRNRRHVIIALLIGSNVANIAASAIVTDAAVNTFGEQGVGIAVGIMTFLILTFGDIAPKSFATTYGDAIILHSAGIVESFCWLMTPLIYLFEFINRLIPGVYARPTGVEKFTEEEVMAAVSLGAQHQSITAQEKKLIENVFAFNDRTVAHAMTPKGKVVSLDANADIPVSYKKALSSAFSRFPVMDGGRVVATVHLKTLGRNFYDHPEWKTGKIGVAPLLVHATDKCNNAFLAMKRHGRNIAIAENTRKEYVGIVTLEDLLDELVGEIN